MSHLRTLALVVLALSTAGFKPPKGPTICVEGQGCGNAASVKVTPDYKQAPGPAAVTAESYQGERLDELRQKSEQGDPVASYKLGTVYRLGLAGTQKSPSEARMHLNAAAEKGHSTAAYDLARMLLESDRADEYDIQEGLRLLYQAHRGGQPFASSYIGQLMFEGRYVARDVTQAAAMFETAAKANVPDAQYYIGQMHFRGVGRRLDGYQAIKWTREAASNGSILAQRALGQLYWAGYETIKRDRGEARKWMSAAAQQGDPDAADFLVRLDGGSYIAEGDMARFLPAGDLIKASTATENAIHQAKQALNDGRGITKLAAVQWARTGGAQVGGAQPDGGSSRVVQTTGGNCYVVESTFPDGRSDAERTTTVCEGADGRIYEA